MSGYPDIGIARVGNNPDEFFIGPELPGDRSIPPGGYKDDMCRVKRQAARFHIFAHHKDGSINEITSDQAEITWTVHLANKKASVLDNTSLRQASQGLHHIFLGHSVSKYLIK